MQIVRALVCSFLFVCASLLGMVCTPSSAIAADLPEIHWSYLDDTGPDHWAELDTTFATCASGQSQSPVNLTAAESADLVNPEFHYQPAPLNLLNNGHTVQVPYAPGSYLTLEGTRYNLLQFHFHSPSEHAIEGQPQAAELHLVHQNEAGELAVVAVMLQANDERSGHAYADLTANLPGRAGDKVRTEKRVNARSLLPAQTTTYRYTGSLTTPPCSESVTWLVMTEPVTLPSEQIHQYQTLLNRNNRPIQTLNSRLVQIDASP